LYERNSWYRLRPILAVLIAAVIAVAVVAAAPAVARVSEDPRQQREEVKAKAAQVAAELDALRATDAEVTDALAARDANVRQQEASLADAQRAAEQAAVAADQARAAEQAAEAELAALRAQLKNLAVAAYVDPSAQGDTGFTVLGADSANQAILKQALVDFRAGSNVDLADRVEAARQDLQTQREAADAALSRAQQAEADAATRVEKVKAARADQQQFATEVDSRIDAALAESAALQSLDAKLSQQIADQQAALARAAAAANPNRGNSGGGGGSTGPPPGGSVSLRTVHGIVVAASIADNLEALLDAAAGDGFTFGGGGYRDPSAQIALRMAHCGTSYYAIYQMPASQCHPPTAPPGTSMHEQGLAVDFTWNGSIISSRSSSAYQWLAAHANGYGFYNLPSEPWHWSTNGN
jgi:hypothetical protein